MSALAARLFAPRKAPPVPGADPWAVDGVELSPAAGFTRAPLRWLDVVVTSAGTCAGYARLAQLDTRRAVVARFDGSPWAMVDADPETSGFAPLYHAGERAPAAFHPDTLAAARHGLAHPGSIGHDCSLLMLLEIGIYPAYRGIGAGARLISECISRYAPEGGLVALCPYPLQLLGGPGPNSDPVWKARDRALQLDAFDRDEHAAVARLYRHYQGWGFAAVRGTDLMVAAPERALDCLARHAAPTGRPACQNTGVPDDIGMADEAVLLPARAIQAEIS